MGQRMRSVLFVLSLLYSHICSGFINHFIELVEAWGFLGYGAYILVYAGLEILALPAIPLVRGERNREEGRGSKSHGLHTRSSCRPSHSM